MSDQRSEARARRRRVVFNNDGCDVYYFPVDQEPTAENLLAMRTTPLAGSHVDAISYTTLGAGFSHFTHDTRVGQVLEGDFGREGRRNIAPVLIDQGRDCLEIMIDFAHEHGMELFWSMRMNDTHDAAHRPDKPYPLFPKLKQAHPEYLIGSVEQMPPYGAWSAVDYGRPEIRELAFRFVEEVCERYDVDGVELDFFRHPVFFRNPAWGEPATAEDVEAMTALMQRIARMVEACGRARGRPILLAIRTPDSAAYCRTIGLDLERWLAEGLVDLYIPSGYFQLNPWERSVELAHHHGVKVHAGLSESRIGGGHHRDPGRSSDEAYRARALNAWDAGVDGLYMFNLFDPHRRIWHELGEPAMLERLPRRYFVDYRGRRRAAGGNYPYDAYFHQPVLNPDDPATLTPGEPMHTALRVSGDLSTAAAGNGQAMARLHVHLDGTAEQVDVTVKLNGTALTDAAVENGRISFALGREQLRRGVNDVEVVAGSSAPELVVRDVELVMGHVTNR